MSESLAERERIDRIVQRDGAEQARAWARRTEALYRTAVLDPRHFAHTPEYRRRFIEAYLELKRFALQGSPRQGQPQEAGSVRKRAQMRP